MKSQVYYEAVVIVLKNLMKVCKKHKIDFECAIYEAQHQVRLGM